MILPPASSVAGDSLEAALRGALAKIPHRETVTGMCVVDLSTGRPVFEEGADRLMIPASNMKVLVMATALEVLGPEFVFETVLVTDGHNIILVGDGDPAFGDRKLYNRREESICADFERWADALLREGITGIPGDIVIDGTIFDDQRLHPSWEKGDRGKWYTAPVGGVNFNNNCLDITVTPGSEVGGLASVSVVPEIALSRITNKCSTTSGGKGRPILHHVPGSLEYIISGSCAKRWPFGAVAFPDPGLLCGEALRSTFEEKGLHVAGTVRNGRFRNSNGELTKPLYIIGRHRSEIGDVLERTGKDSQNLFAECLLKRTGYAFAIGRGEADARGSWSTGAEAILETLGRVGVDVTGMIVADGSGLSRKNRCSARQLAATLARIQGRREGRLLRDSLSVAGVDGSLRKRLPDLPGRVYGKTGTMRGIRTLSGYVLGKSAPSGYAFAVLFNGYTGPSTPYREIQDRICRVLIENLDMQE